MAVLYLQAQRTGTVEAWNAFLEICGDSPYCKLAAAARAKLVPPKAPKVSPPVVEPRAAEVEPAPLADAPEEAPAAVAAPSVPVPEPAPVTALPNIPELQAPSPAEAKPAVVPTPLPKPPQAKVAAKPKPKPRPQPQQPEPEYTGSIPQSAPTALPGTQPQATRQRGLLQSDSQPAQTSGLKPKPENSAKSTREFRRSMFPHLRTN
jgi:hypothetical protein